MADEIRAPLILDDSQAIGPLRRVGAEARKQLGASAAAEMKKKLAESATVSAKLAREIGKLNAKAKFNEAKAASAEYRQAVERAANSTRQLRGETNNAASSVKLAGAGAVAAYTQISSAITRALDKAVEFSQAIWDSGKAGAKLQDLRSAYEALGGTASEMDKLKEAVNNTVGESKLLQVRNMGVALGIPAEKFSILAKVAQNAALSTGQSFEYMIDSVVRGTARESALILDNLGIKLQDAEQQLGVAYKEMGVAAEDATAKQRSLAFIQVVEANAASLSVVGGLRSESAAYAQVEASIADMVGEMQISISQMLAGAGVFDVIRGVVGQVGAMFEANKDLIRAFIDDGLSFLVELLPTASDAFGGLMSAVKLVMDIVRPFIPLIELTVKAMMLPIKVIGALITKLTELSIVQTVLDGLQTAFQWLSDAVSELIDGLGWLLDKLGMGGMGGSDDGVIGVAGQARNAILRLADAHADAAAAAKKHADEVEEAGRRISASYQVNSMDRGFGFGSDQAQQQQAYQKNLEDYLDREFKNQKGGGSNATSSFGSAADRFGLSSIGDRAAGAGSSLLGSFSQAYQTGQPGTKQGFSLESFAKALQPADQLADAFGRAIDRAADLAEATRTLGETAQASLTDGFLGAFGAIANGSASFREAMFSSMGGMLGELATAFGAWAVTEGALLSGQPWLAAVTVGLMKVAAKKVAGFGKRSSGGSTGGSQESRYMSKKQDNQMATKQVIEVNINSIPVPDRLAKEMAVAVTRGLKLTGG